MNCLLTRISFQSSMKVKKNHQRPLKLKIDASRIGKSNSHKRVKSIHYCPKYLPGAVIIYEFNILSFVDDFLLED